MMLLLTMMMMNMIMLLLIEEEHKAVPSACVRDAVAVRVKVLGNRVIVSRDVAGTGYLPSFITTLVDLQLLPVVSLNFSASIMYGQIAHLCARQGLMSESVAVCDRVLKEAQQLKMDYETKLSSLSVNRNLTRNFVNLQTFH
ncbi:hypothetical protein DPMN_128529 [Dreissena polymorpha]|uniref:Uncharacterized protein n=1 Tax=Dreissena polymorpha TaxID=45954 RepID=A0A9D4H355_DREPO|nr:hypothetical protein DPMN_128529 [Dreissena polymorpha]